MRAVVAVAWAALVLAACGGGSSAHWSHLKAVRVTVAQPGLPPPSGAPHTTSFTTPRQLARVTAALNAHHIAQGSPTSATSACSGGYQVAILIVPRERAPIRLTAYRCANTTTGAISGDLAGFLAAVGLAL